MVNYIFTGYDAIGQSKDVTGEAKSFYDLDTVSS